MKLEPLLTSRAHETPSLQDRAAENLRFIRRAMEHASSFTAVPGRGAIWMGLTALAAAALASAQDVPGRWLAVWLVEAGVAIAIGLAAIVLKARAHGLPLFSGPARKFALALTPTILAGAALTPALIAAGAHDLLPATWLLLYGAAVVAGGAFSVRVVPVTGLGFMILGVALLAIGSILSAIPPALNDAFMAAGFGGLHILSGGWITWRHGG